MMNKISVAAAAVESVDVENATPYTDYSGRGMYGDTCLGVVVSDLGTAFAWMSELVDHVHDDELIQDLKGAIKDGTRHDNMGRDTIVYWPTVSVHDDASVVLR